MNVTSMQKGGFRRKGCPVVLGVVFVHLHPFVHIVVYIISVYSFTGKNNVRIFGIRCLRQSDKRTNRYKTRNGFSKLDLCQGGSFSQVCDLQQWHWAKCFPHFGFYMFVRLSLCRRRRMPKKITFWGGLVDINNPSFLTSWVFWFAFLNASSHLCFWLVFFSHWENK